MSLLHTPRKPGIRCVGFWRRLPAGLCAAALLLLVLGMVGPVSADNDLEGNRAAIDLTKLKGQIIVNPNDDLRQLDNFSFDMDVRFSNLRTGNFFQLNKAWDQDGFYFQLYEGQLVLGFGDKGSLSQVVSPPNLLQTNRWYRLSGVKDGNMARLLIDGDEVAKHDVSADITDSISPLIIGPTGYATAAQISRVLLWPEALDPDDTERFLAGQSSAGAPAPLLHYEFEEARGLEIKDIADGSHNARIEADPNHQGWIKPGEITASDHDRSPTSDAHARHGMVAVLDLSGADDAVVVDRLTMPSRGQDFALQLDLMLNEPSPGIIAYARSEHGAFFSIEHDADRLLFTLGDGRERASISSPAGMLETNKWMTITTSHSNGIASLLIDGIRVASFATPSGLDDGPMHLSIGEGNQAARFHFGALKVWGRSLNADERDAGVFSAIDQGDPDLLLALGPWKQMPAGSVLENQTGRDAHGMLRGDSSDLWVDMDTDTMSRISPDLVRLALGQAQRDGQNATPRARNETGRRGATRADLFEIPQGQSRIMTLSAPAETIIVDDENVAQVEILSPRKLYMFGVHAGRTSIRALDGQSEIVQETTIRVGADTDAAEQELATIDGGEDNRVTDNGGRATLEGPVDDVAEAMALAALSESPTIGDTPARNATTIDSPQQVNIKVRFAEVSRSDLNLLGINWSAVINAGTFGDAAAGQFFLADGLLGAAGSAVGQIDAGDVDINFLLEALQQEGAISMLAEPNLTVLNGEEARFLAGGELPIPVPQDSSGATTVEFKPFGVSLDFRPIILGNNRISLRVASEVSDISTAGAVQLGSLFVPGISVRRAETSLELASGQTFVVGGLFNRTISSDIEKIPGLGSIPILGALFRSTRFQRSETELVILITPYLVRPVDNPGDLAFPGQSDAPRTAGRNERQEPTIGTGFIVR